MAEVSKIADYPQTAKASDNGFQEIRVFVRKTSETNKSGAFETGLADELTTSILKKGVWSVLARQSNKVHGG